MGDINTELGPLSNNANELHDEFRSLSSTLVLATAFNRGGHSTLTIDERVTVPYIHTSSTHRHTISMLDAINTLLERRHDEVVAVTACGPSRMTDSDGSGRMLTSYDVIALHDEGNRDPASATHPRHKSLNTGGPQATHCLLTCNGISHWPSIRDSKDRWFGLGLTADDPLENHIATLNEYICQYKMQSPAAPAPSRMERFARYIFAVSWRKMQRRINYWISEGYIYILSSITDDRVNTLVGNALPKMKISPRRDSELGTALLDMEDKTVVHIMSQYPSASQVTLTKLRAAFREVLGGKATEHGTRTPYTKETCVEFHNLLIATLLGYGKSIRELHDATNVVHADNAYHFARLLRKLLASQMLSYHLRALESDLEPPSYTLKSRYSKFTEFTKGPGKEAPGPGKDMEPGIDMESCADGGESAEDGVEFVDATGYDCFDQDRDAHKASKFKEWMGLQVSHLSALLSLATHSRANNSPQHVNIVLLTVRHVSRPVPMEHWMNTINKHFVNDQSTPLTAQNAIDEFGKRIREAIGLANVPQYEILRTFKKNIIDAKFRHGDSSLEFSGAVHCEAALASLMAYPNEALNLNDINQPTLDTIVHNLNPTAIAVSKLCCPVCWELLDILRAASGSGSQKNFWVHGYHSILSLVELPAWLPVSVLQEMVVRFRMHLRKELSDMIGKSGHSC